MDKTRAVALPATPDRTRQGILLICLGALVLTCMTTMVKYLSASFHPFQLIWARYFFYVLQVAAIHPQAVPRLLTVRDKSVQMSRGALLLGSTMFHFSALAYLPLPVMSAIGFLVPLLVTAMSVPVLGETVSLQRWFAVGLGLVGALVVVRPGMGMMHPAAIVALGFAVSYALYQVTTRMARADDSWTSLLYGGVVGMVVTTLIVPFVWQWPSLTEWLLLGALGLFAAGGHLLVIMALQRGEASKVSPFTYTQIIWSTLSSLVFFGDVPDVWTFVGAGIIAISGLWSLLWARR